MTKKCGKMIDWQECIKRANKKENLARYALTMFTKRLPIFKANIEAELANENKNMRELYDNFHNLHTSSLYCGVKKIQEITLILEVLAQNEKNLTEIKNLTPKLFEYIDCTLAESKKII